MTHPPSQAERQRAVTDFNARYTIGDAFWAYTGLRGENPIACTLRTPAELLSGHTPVAWLNGVSGCIALTHLEPRQPEPLLDDAGADEFLTQRALQRDRETYDGESAS